MNWGRVFSWRKSHSHACERQNGHGMARPTFVGLEIRHGMARPTFVGRRKPKGKTRAVLWGSANGVIERDFTGPRGFADTTFGVGSSRNPPGRKGDQYAGSPTQFPVGPY